MKQWKSQNEDIEKEKNIFDIHNDEDELDYEATLKRRLAGPSVLKSGQESVDQERINEIIYEASKGSKYFEAEQKRDLELRMRIERVRQEVKEYYRKLEHNNAFQKEWAERTDQIDTYMQELQSCRDLSQVIVHVDCDAFYASVEELRNEKLKNIPMAVGKGVLCTANYMARKFGVRSAMPEFIAKKLCPELVVLPLDIPEYAVKSKEIQNLLLEYDQNLCPASIDEVYMNLTPYMNRNKLNKDEDTMQQVIMEIRNKVLKITGVSISCGIAANKLLAKIASNMKKPNDQYLVPIEAEVIEKFMSKLPTRRINGIGRVLEQELLGLDIETCGDILNNRTLLSYIFREKTFQNLIQCSLGIGSTIVQDFGDSYRKSIGCEITFSNAIASGGLLESKLQALCQSLAESLSKRDLIANSISVKIKTDTFQVHTRQKNLREYIFNDTDLFCEALRLLRMEYPLRIRLLGVRASKLTNKASYIASRIKFSKQNSVSCPVCRIDLKDDLAVVNQHIDLCLNTETVKKVIDNEKKEIPLKRKRNTIDAFFRH
ncbi:DinB translesion DNA repair polymerase [Schizosaccharomyces cryophilus OY26]|uniref:DNA polymerase kappa n=1 Tax=Schizosaccharomyces cryophilus (strain OY26 / ATCC MYA-4695 / CBS 11777 / NBRC 106824 / NRRL Y48691) TaxID=653667 RepID=S9VV06_SCHCR|nr:DinB translesion DNA repair polymerase [Schizosaccharomyces cryophilus OY26]EPY50024.1 DinB translesion DNA repair polymerase [Schizosaccharomyces cryophilus OY26]